MSVFEQHQKFYNKPILLLAEEQTAPYLVLNYFAEAYHLWEIRDYLSKLKQCAVTSHDEFIEASERKDIIYFIEEIERLAEAVYQSHLVGKILDDLTK